MNNQQKNKKNRKYTYNLFKNKKKAFKNDKKEIKNLQSEI